MKMLLAFVALVILTAACALVFFLKDAPPEVRFATAKLEDLVDTLNTNGKVEPVSWTALRADRAGRLLDVRVHRGSNIAADAVVGVMEDVELQAALETAQARLVQVEGEAESVAKGGRSSARAEIEGNISRLRVQIADAEVQLSGTERLVARQAATVHEADRLRANILLLRDQLRGLEENKKALVSNGDRQAAAGRIQEAKAAVELAQRNLERRNIRSPLEGIVYQIDLLPGAYLNPGDLLAHIGKLDVLQVHVYVDEPELGRVSIGQSVTVTWDARPGKEWSGQVEMLPTQIVALGSRQVGEVLVKVTNSDNTLPPGANVNVAIRRQTVHRATTIPKEALRRENGVTGVLLLEKDFVVWRPVQTGLSNMLRTQVTRGLRAGDRVALATDLPLRHGSSVKPLPESAY
ncbi:MAG: efflux RND transporter periplasmic adaptor subunit [Acidobacteriota bacterium]